MNIVAIAGNLARDPELRYTGTGTPVCSMRLAVDIGGDSEPLFIDISAWEKLATACAESLRKGSKIAVQGSLRPESWTAEDGSKRTKISVRAHSVEFMSSRPEGDAPRALSSEQTDLPF